MTQIETYAEINAFSGNWRPNERQGDACWGLPYYTHPTPHNPKLSSLFSFRITRLGVLSECASWVMVYPSSLRSEFWLAQQSCSAVTLWLRCLQQWQQWQHAPAGVPCALGIADRGFYCLNKTSAVICYCSFWEQSVRGQNRYSLRYVQNSPPPPLAKRYKMNGVPTAHSRASEVHERPYAETKLQRLPLGMGFGPASACIHPVTLLPEIFHLLRFQKLFLYFWFISPQKFWRSKPQRNKLSRELSIFPNIYISIDVMSAPVRSPPLALAFPESTDSRIN